MTNYNILADFIQFSKKNKKWYLMPILILLLLGGLFIVLSTSSAIAPFLYPVF